MSEITIGFGALSLPISEQLSESGIDEKTLNRFDMVAKAITQLHILGYIPPSQTDKSRKKLMKEIQKKLDEAVE